MLRDDSHVADFSDATAGILASVDLLLQQTQGSFLHDDDDGDDREGDGSDRQYALPSSRHSAHPVQRAVPADGAAGFVRVAPVPRTTIHDENLRRAIQVAHVACESIPETRCAGIQHETSSVAACVQTVSECVGFLAAYDVAPRPAETKAVACQTDSASVRSTQTDTASGARAAEVNTDICGGIIAEDAVAQSLVVPVLQWTRAFERATTRSLGDLSTRLVKQVRVALPRVRASLQRKTAECCLAHEDAMQARSEAEALKQALHGEEQQRKGAEGALEKQRIDFQDLRARFEAVTQNNLILADRVQLLEELVFRYEALLVQQRKPAAVRGGSDVDSTEEIVAHDADSCATTSSVVRTPRRRGSAVYSTRAARGEAHKTRADEESAGYGGCVLPSLPVAEDSSSSPSLCSLMDLYRQCELALRDGGEE